MTTINMTDKFVRRCDLDEHGQPKSGAEPVKVLTTTLFEPYTIAYQSGEELSRVKVNGTLCGGEEEHAVDLLPWPSPPQIVPWETLDEVPLEAWFRSKTYQLKNGETDRTAVRVNLILFDRQQLSVFDDDDGKPELLTLEMLLDQCEVTCDSGKSWLPCGKVAP